MNSGGRGTTGIVLRQERLLVTSLNAVRRRRVETASTSGAVFRTWPMLDFRLLRLRRTEVLLSQNTSEPAAGSSFRVLRSNSFTRWVIRTSTSHLTVSLISRPFTLNTKGAIVFAYSELRENRRRSFLKSQSVIRQASKRLELWSTPGLMHTTKRKPRIAFCGQGSIVLGLSLSKC